MAALRASWKQAGTMLLMAGGLCVAIIGWNLYQTEQMHLRERVVSLATHLEQAEDGLRAWQGNRTDAYDRYRAVFHLQSFGLEVGSLSEWTKQPAAPPDARWWIDGLVKEPPVMDAVPLRQNLAGAAKALRGLAAQRFITRAATAEAFHNVSLLMRSTTGSSQ